MLREAYDRDAYRVVYIANLGEGDLHSAWVHEEVEVRDRAVEEGCRLGRSYSIDRIYLE
jgi:hypothetical protein